MQRSVVVAVRKRNRGLGWEVSRFASGPVIVNAFTSDTRAIVPEEISNAVDRAHYAPRPCRRRLRRREQAQRVPGSSGRSGDGERRRRTGGARDRGGRGWRGK